MRRPNSGRRSNQREVERGDVADDDRARRLDAEAGDRRERAAHRALLGPGAPPHRGDRRVGRAAAVDQRLARSRRRGPRPSARRACRPPVRARPSRCRCAPLVGSSWPVTTVTLVDTPRCVTGMPGVRRRRDRARDAGHDFERHAGRDARLGLLAAAAEHERVAALEPHDRAAGAPRSTSTSLICSWVIATPARRLAHVDELGVRAARARAARGDASRSYTTTSARAQQLLAAPRQQARDHPVPRRRGTPSRRRPRRRARPPALAVEQVARGRRTDLGRIVARRRACASTTWPSSDASSASSTTVVAPSTRAERAARQVAAAAELGEERALRDRPRGARSRSSIAASRASVRSSSARHSTASAPCATCGSSTAGFEHLGRRGRASPSRSSAAHRDDDRVVALRRRCLRRRVSMLPRSGAEHEVGPGGRELGPAAHRAGADRAPPGGMSSSVAPTSASRGSPRSGTAASTRPAAVVGRQVLGRVHRDVGPAVEHGLLHLLHEHALCRRSRAGRTSGRGRRSS